MWSLGASSDPTKHGTAPVTSTSRSVTRCHTLSHAVTHCHKLAHNDTRTQWEGKARGGAVGIATSGADGGVERQRAAPTSVVREVSAHTEHWLS